MISVWHWLSLLLVLAIPIGIAAVAARSNKDTTRRIGRGGYLKRWALLFLVNAIIGFVLGAVAGEKAGDIFIVLVAGPIAIAFMAYWSVDRLRDIGASGIKLAYFVGVPLVGLFVILYLMIKKGAPVDASSSSETVAHPPT